jgi:hypothetical protein
MNGPDLAAHAARRRPALPILMTSGSRSQGASADILSKPFRRSQLAAAVAVAIGGRRTNSLPPRSDRPSASPHPMPQRIAK